MSDLNAGVLRLLEQCDREDENAENKRYLFTSEIRYLLGVGPAPTYDGLRRALKDAVPAPPADAPEKG